MVIAEYKWIPTCTSYLEQCIQMDAGVWAYPHFGTVDTTFGQPPNKLCMLLEAGQLHVEFLGMQVLNPTIGSIIKCTVWRKPMIREPGDVRLEAYNLNTASARKGYSPEHIVWGQCVVEQDDYYGQAICTTYIPGGAVALECTPPTPLHIDPRGLLLVEIEVVSGNVAEFTYTALLREYPQIED